MVALEGLGKRVTAAAALGAITVGLCAGGAQSAADSALLSFALCLTLAVAALAAPGPSLARLAGRYGLGLLAVLGFTVMALATAWIAPANSPSLLKAAWHPLWRELGLPHGAISLAPYRTIEGLIAFFAPAAAFAIGALVTEDREDRSRLSFLLMAGATAFAVTALYWMWTARAGEHRLDAHLGSPNAAATTLGVFAILLTARALRATRRPSERALAQIPRQFRPLQIVFLAPVTLSVLALTLGSLVMTSSRAGIMATFGGFVLFGLLVAAARRKQEEEAVGSDVLIGIAVIAAILLAAGAHLFLPRLLNVAEDAGIRGALIDMHWGVFLERPVLGHGLHTFHELNAHYLTPETWRDAAHVGAVHNIYVQALEEVGIVGFALLALMLAPPLVRTLLSALAAGPGTEWAAAALSIAALTLAHGMVDFGLQVPALAALVMFCLGAFANGGGRGARQRSEQRSSERDQQRPKANANRHGSRQRHEDRQARPHPDVARRLAQRLFGFDGADSGLIHVRHNVI